MKDKKDKQNKTDDNRSRRVSDLGRRDLMKLGVGAGVGAVTEALLPSTSAAQSKDKVTPLQQNTGKGVVPGAPPYISSHQPTRRVAKYGWKNTSGRAYGNGPMDAISKQIVSYVKSFHTPVTDSMIKNIAVMNLLDTIGCGIAGFETDSARAGARVAKLYPGGELKSTVWGYGITTVPEVAGFVGSCMVRHYDNNHAGLHESDIVPGILALGEALHSSGDQVLQAMICAWEVFAALEEPLFTAPGSPGLNVFDSYSSIHCPMMAMAAGKLLNLNEDQLANALSLAQVCHLSLHVEHFEGPNSMSKANHDAELVRAGIWVALCARAGITGPAEPYTGAKGLQDVVTGPFTITLPAKKINNPSGYFTVDRAPGDNRFALETMIPKRLPANGGAPISQCIPEMRKFAKIEEIESIEIQSRQWGDGSDPRKWDPLNSETADHSLAYCFARLMLDGDLYLDSYEMDKLTDPKVRALMARMTIVENPDLKMNRVTLKKKSGETLVRDVGEYPSPMTVDAVNAKFDRNCAYRKVTDAQRDKIRSTWADIRNVKDIAVPIKETLATFGQPKPL